MTGVGAERNSPTTRLGDSYDADYFGDASKLPLSALTTVSTGEKA
jgi:hypothetical protein